MQEQGECPAYPENPARYLTDWLFDVGPVVAGGMGEAPIAYTDLQAWESISGVQLLPWEARTLRALSVDFVAERSRAREVCPPPYSRFGGAERAALDDKIKSMFGRMKKAGG